MMQDRIRRSTHEPKFANTVGFTVLEILIALALGMVFIVAISALIIDQTQIHEDHQMKVMMQQDARSALAVMSSDIHLAGYAPVDDVGSCSVTKAAMDCFEYEYQYRPSLRDLSHSNDGDSISKMNVGFESAEYSHESSDNSVRRRTMEYPIDPDHTYYRRKLLDNVEALRLLYAYDRDDLGSGNDKHGVLEQVAVSGTNRTAWAFDKDDNGELDHYYVLNNDGLIASGPTPLVPNISIDRVRAAKIWLLMRSHKRKNKDTVEAGLPGSIPGKDEQLLLSTLDSDYAYRLYTTTVKLRNMYY